MSAEDLRGLAAYDQARAERPTPPRCEACDALADRYCSDECMRRAEAAAPPPDDEDVGFDVYLLRPK